MKYLFILPKQYSALILLLFAAQWAHAQIKPVNLFQATGANIPHSGSLPENTIRNRPVRLNPDALQAERISLTLFDGETVEFQRVAGENERVFEGGWSGTAIEGSMGHLSITPTSAGLHATVFWGTKFFRVAPIGNGGHLLLEIDRSSLPDEDCRDLKTKPSFFQKIENAPEAPGDDPIGCNIRLLVAYTDAANTWAMANGFGDALGLAQAAIDATNQTYINSQIVFRVELAHLLRVGYNESGSFATDVDAFQDPSDGDMDEVHALRDHYRADLCVLITEGNSACGRAYEIGAEEDEAFCAANAHCCVGNFSFAHELGHLYGARHDPFADNTNVPFPFGHGFVEISETWRTVMSYNDACVDAGTSCDRIGFWSNPDIDHPSTTTTMGTAADNNNARVLNTTGDDLRGYRTQANDYILSNTTLTGVTFADLTVVNTILAGNDYFVDPTADVRFRAGEFVRLTPGFEARPGADFRASIQPIDPCDGGRPSDQRFVGDDQSSHLTLSPNPVSERLLLEYLMTQEGEVSIVVLNTLGEVVASPLHSQFQNLGSQNLQIPVDILPDGLYWCVVLYPGGEKAHKPFVVTH